MEKLKIIQINSCKAALACMHEHITEDALKIFIERARDRFEQAYKCKDRGESRKKLRLLRRRMRELRLLHQLDNKGATNKYSETLTLMGRALDKKINNEEKKSLDYHLKNARAYAEEFVPYGDTILIKDKILKYCTKIASFNFKKEISNVKDFHNLRKNVRVLGIISRYVAMQTQSAQFLILHQTLKQISMTLGKYHDEHLDASTITISEISELKLVKKIFKRK